MRMHALCPEFTPRDATKSRRSSSTTCDAPGTQVAPDYSERAISSNANEFLAVVYHFYTEIPLFVDLSHAIWSRRAKYTPCLTFSAFSDAIAAVVGVVAEMAKYTSILGVVSEVKN